MAKVKRQCQMCDKDFKTEDGDKYCVPCRVIVLAEVREVGYLEPTPRIGCGSRSRDAWENVYETKFGVNR